MMLRGASEEALLHALKLNMAAATGQAVEGMPSHGLLNSVEATVNGTGPFYHFHYHYVCPSGGKGSEGPAMAAEGKGSSTAGPTTAPRQRSLVDAAVSVQRSLNGARLSLADNLPIGSGSVQAFPATPASPAAAEGMTRAVSCGSAASSPRDVGPNLDKVSSSVAVATPEFELRHQASASSVRGSLAGSRQTSVSRRKNSPRETVGGSISSTLGNAPTVRFAAEEEFRELPAAGDLSGGLSPNSGRRPIAAEPNDRELASISNQLPLPAQGEDAVSAAESAQNGNPLSPRSHGSFMGTSFDIYSRKEHALYSPLTGPSDATKTEGRRSTHSFNDMEGSPSSSRRGITRGESFMSDSSSPSSSSRSPSPYPMSRVETQTSHVAVRKPAYCVDSPLEAYPHTPQFDGFVAEWSAEGEQAQMQSEQMRPARPSGRDLLREMVGAERDGGAAFSPRTRLSASGVKISSPRASKQALEYIHHGRLRVDISGKPEVRCFAVSQVGLHIARDTAAMVSETWQKEVPVMDIRGYRVTENHIVVITGREQITLRKADKDKDDLDVWLRALQEMASHVDELHRAEPGRVVQQGVLKVRLRSGPEERLCFLYPDRFETFRSKEEMSEGGKPGMLIKFSDVESLEVQGATFGLQVRDRWLQFQAGNQEAAEAWVDSWRTSLARAQQAQSSPSQVMVPSQFDAQSQPPATPGFEDPGILHSGLVDVVLPDGSTVCRQLVARRDCLEICSVSEGADGVEVAIPEDKLMLRDMRGVKAADEGFVVIMKDRKIKLLVVDDQELDRWVNFMRDVISGLRAEAEKEMESTPWNPVVARSGSPSSSLPPGPTVRMPLKLTPSPAVRNQACQKVTSRLHPAGQTNGSLASMGTPDRNGNHSRREFLQKSLTHHQVKAWLDATTPIHHGLMAVLQENEMAWRFFALFTDRLDCWMKPMDAASGINPMLSIPFSSIKSVETVGGGFRLSCWETKFGVHVSSQADLRDWSRALLQALGGGLFHGPDVQRSPGHYSPAGSSRSTMNGKSSPRPARSPSPGSRQGPRSPHRSTVGSNSSRRDRSREPSVGRLNKPSGGNLARTRSPSPVTPRTHGLR